MDMKKTEKIWLDGKMVRWEDANVHVLSHALNYGTSVFEGIRVYQTDKGPAVFRLREHMTRLLEGCRIMAIPAEFGGKKYELDELIEAVKQVVRENKDVDYIKPFVFLRGENVGLNPINVPASMSITGVNMGMYLGKDAAAGAKIMTSSWHRPDNLSTPAGAKIGGTYVTSCLAKREAVEQGASEAVMLNGNGYVAECTGENIFIYKRGKIYTPKPSNSILEGITRNSVMQVARDLGYEVIETDISRVELLTSDEVWMTGTAAEVVIVTMIDNRPVGSGKPGKVATELQKRFADIVRGKDEKYASWVEHVN